MYGNQYGIIPTGEQQQQPPPPQYPPPSVPPQSHPAAAASSNVAGSYNTGYSNPTASQSLQHLGVGMYGGGFYGQPQAQPQQQAPPLHPYPSSQYYSSAAAASQYSYGQPQPQPQQSQPGQMMYAGGYPVTQQQQQQSPPVVASQQPRTINVPNPPPPASAQQQQQKQQPNRTRNSYSTMRPPYIDPTTNIIYDVDNPEYEGWLTKQSVWLKVSSTIIAVLNSKVFVHIVLRTSMGIFEILAD